MEIERASSHTGYIKFSDHKEPISFLQSCRNMLKTGPLNILLLASPIALILYWAQASDVATFIFSLIAIAPLAERLGFVTETLAMHTNDTIGGLLNATFGNATELIVSITALARGLYRLVQLSLLGSILSNLLLVLGMSLWWGGIRNKTQTFGTLSSQVNSTLLMIVTMAISYPTILRNTGKQSAIGELGFSRATSFLLMTLYVCFIYFQIHTHRFLYEEDDIGDETSSKVKEEQVVIENTLHQTDEANKNSNGEWKTDIENVDKEQQETTVENKEKKDDDEEEEEDLLGFTNALIWLGIITLLLAVLSDALSSSIENAGDDAGVSKVFLSAIVLPIVGNAAEHASSIVCALKNKVDLAIGITVGSSTQIALFVFPLLVVFGWMMDKDLTLNIGTFEIATLILTTISVTFALKDGKSTWIVGLSLIIAYLVICCAFWAQNDTDLDVRY